MKESNGYSEIHNKLSSCLQASCILCTQSEKKVDKYDTNSNYTQNALNTITYAATIAFNLPCEDIYLDL